MYWATGILGVLLGIAPFVFGYRDNSAALWTSVIVGAIVLVASIYEAMDEQHAKWEYLVTGLAGIVAVIAPFVLGFSLITTAMWTAIVLGALMVVLGGYEVFYAEPRTR